MMPVSVQRLFVLSATLVVAACTMQRPEPVVAPRTARIDGIDNGRGACIAGRQSEDSCAFAIGVLEDAKDEPVAVLSRRLIDYDGAGRPNWQVEDSLSIPRARGDLHLEESSCRFDGSADESIVALVPTYDEHAPEWIRAQEWAYKVQLPSGKFMALEPGRVDCHNTTIGAD